MYTAPISTILSAIIIGIFLSYIVEKLSERRKRKGRAKESLRWYNANYLEEHKGNSHKFSFNGISWFDIKTLYQDRVSFEEDLLKRGLKKGTLNWYHKAYLYKQGASAGFANSYRLISIDGGKNWLALDNDRNVLGYVKEVYPGLLEHINGIEKLIEYATKNRSIDPGDTNEKEIELLTAAEFEVKKNI